jgi:hypothetical protein
VTSYRADARGYHALSLDEVVGLDGVPAGQCVAVVGGEGVQPDLDESSVELVH